MKISIITVSFNAENTIEDTICSVLEQSYEDIEYIIIDGQSTDSTMEIIERYKRHIDTIISELDEGIYDAMNKGIQKATGDVVGILNADDVYANENVIKRVVEKMQENEADALYGDLVYVHPKNTDKVKRKWISGLYNEGLFLKGWMPPHPTFFLKKDHYLQKGGYTKELKTAADYELMLRMIHRYSIKPAYLPEVMVKMRTGGESNVSLKNRWNANREDRKAWKMNGLKPGLFTSIRKPLSKVGQFLKK